MKKIAIFFACILVCLCLFSGCTDDKQNSNSSTDSGNAVEVEIDTEGNGDTDIPLNDDIDYEFKDPDNADGIEVAPKE